LLLGAGAAFDQASHAVGGEIRGGFEPPFDNAGIAGAAGFDPPMGAVGFDPSPNRNQGKNKRKK
jgi:hypothetical protein